MIKKIDQLIAGAIFITFLALSVFIFFTENDESPSIIKEGKKLSSNKYFSFFTDIIQKNNEINNFAFVYLGSICLSCPSGWLVYKLDSLQSVTLKTKYIILLPEEFTENDISNLKSNNSLKLDFMNVGAEFQQLINANKNLKNRYPFTGLTIVTNSSDIVVYSRYLNNKGIGLKAKIHNVAKLISQM